MVNARRDEIDVLMVPIVSLLLYYLVQLTVHLLAVTNNSSVWRPQGTHSEAYTCVTLCIWLFISSDY